MPQSATSEERGFIETKKELTITTHSLKVPIISPALLPFNSAKTGHSLSFHPRFAHKTTLSSTFQQPGSLAPSRSPILAITPAPSEHRVQPLHRPNRVNWIMSNNHQIPGIQGCSFYINEHLVRARDWNG